MIFQPQAINDSLNQHIPTPIAVAKSIFDDVLQPQSDVDEHIQKPKISRARTKQKVSEIVTTDDFLGEMKHKAANNENRTKKL